MINKYCIDTNIFIDAWVTRYPPDTFPKFWVNMDGLIAKEGVISPDEVLRELERKDDDLHTWAKSKTGLFYPIDSDIQVAVSEVLAAFPRLVDTKKNRSQADPFVIALARVTGRSVVTNEKPSSNTDVPKIPDACSHFGVRCVSLLEFIREQKWIF
jgi:hypothetical protein